MRVSEGINFDHEAYNDLMERMERLIETSEKLMSQNIMLKEKRLLSPKEVADLVGYNEKTIRAKKSEIGFFTIGKEIKFKPKDVDAWIEKYYIKPMPARRY